MGEVTDKMEGLQHPLPTKSSVDGLSRVLDILPGSQVTLEQGAKERAKLSLQGSFSGPLPAALTWRAQGAAGSCSHFPSGCHLRDAPQAARRPLPLGSRPAARTPQAQGGPVGFWAGQDPVNPGLQRPAGGGGSTPLPPAAHGGAGGAMRAPSGSGLRAQPDSGLVQSGE